MRWLLRRDDPLPPPEPDLTPPQFQLEIAIRQRQHEVRLDSLLAQADASTGQDL